MQDAIISFPLFGLSIDPPRFFTIFGFNIHFYGIALGLGLVMGALYAMRRAKDFGLTSDNVLDFLIFAVPSAVIFSRLYYVAFNWHIYSQDPIRVITGVRSGGLTIYGVIFGAVLGTWICSRIKKLSFLDFIDLGAGGLLIGQAIGRWGNFINREIYGRETDLPWRMGLTAAGETIYVHPTFLYEALWNTLGLILLHTYTKKIGRAYKGQIFILYLGWYGLGRTWVEALRDPGQNMLIGVVSLNMIIAISCFVGAIVANVILTRKAKEA
ncbi:MAG: prolipoprotein diacylglyceryl transferase [Oscillospiraceae bacterium]|nr:prolipoprotein diacylglyceryl transferase [Oscillospiraceae bacterium]